MLQLTAPATGKDGTCRAHPFLRGSENLLRFSVSDSVLDLQYPERDFLSRQTIRHEKSNSFVPDNSFTVAAQSVCHGTDDLIFLNHSSAFFLLILFRLFSGFFRLFSKATVFPPVFYFASDALVATLPPFYPTSASREEKAQKRREQTTTRRRKGR